MFQNILGENTALKYNTTSYAVILEVKLYAAAVCLSLKSTELKSKGRKVVAGWLILTKYPVATTSIRFAQTSKCEAVNETLIIFPNSNLDMLIKN